MFCDSLLLFGYIKYFYLIKYNMKILIVKKKTICIFLAILLIFCSILGIFYAVSATSSPKHNYTVVVDAGHGGIDNGSIGYAGTLESEINLWYANTLKEYLSQFGFKVVMTRSDDNGLYSPFAQNKKKDDMQARQKIIEKSKPDMVISIHMNSFSQVSSRGAQVFYAKDSTLGELLAQNIQEQFKKTLVKPRSSCQVGDYFIVNCTSYPSVIVECGFISNPEEEQLLLTEDYKNQVCYSVVCGVLSYLMET